MALIILYRNHQRQQLSAAAAYRPRYQLSSYRPIMAAISAAATEAGRRRGDNTNVHLRIKCRLIGPAYPPSIISHHLLYQYSMYHQPAIICNIVIISYTAGGSSINVENEVEISDRDEMEAVMGDVDSGGGLTVLFSIGDAASIVANTAPSAINLKAGVAGVSAAIGHRS